MKKFILDKDICSFLYLLSEEDIGNLFRAIIKWIYLNEEEFENDPLEELQEDGRGNNLYLIFELLLQRNELKIQKENTNK